MPFDLLPDSPHTGRPVAHEIDPFLHGFAGWQLMLIVQAPHVPPLHTMFVPHDVPFGWSPVSLHTIVPVAHEFAPVLHRFVGWQLVPDVQAEHVPLLHT